MNDDFEEYLRAAQPAESPPELMRRLRQAEPALKGAATWWWRATALTVFVGVATVTLLGMLVSSHPIFPAGYLPERQVAPTEANPPAGDDHHGFGGGVTLNIELGATPNLIPVSLRPNYDPRALHSPAGLLVANPISESAPRF